MSKFVEALKDIFQRLALADREDNKLFSEANDLVRFG